MVSAIHFYSVGCAGAALDPEVGAKLCFDSEVGAGRIDGSDAVAVLDGNGSCCRAANIFENNI